MQTQQTPVLMSRILARILRQLLADEAFATLADLTDALKTRCARLRIPFTVDELNEAYLVVGSNHPLITSAIHRRTNPTHVERIDPPPPITHREAVEILADINNGSLVDHASVAIKTIPAVSVPEQETDEDFEAARQRAAEMGIELTR